MQYIFGENRQTSKLAINRLLRSAMTLNSYNFDIIHLPGKENLPVDFLSRLKTMIKAPLDLSAYTRILQMRLRKLSVGSRKRHHPFGGYLLHKVLFGKKKVIAANLIPYYEKKPELSYEENILLWKGGNVSP